jgi:uncharacterized membrane protein
MGYIQPLRIAGAVVGGLFALIAALGLWRLRKWGMVLAIILAVVCVVAAGLTFAAPLLRSVPGLMLLTGSTWPAIGAAVGAITAAVLALLPVSRKAYVVPVARPKERRVV